MALLFHGAVELFQTFMCLYRLCIQAEQPDVCSGGLQLSTSWNTYQDLKSCSVQLLRSKTGILCHFASPLHYASVIF
jgi:hypothetical protein